MNKSLKIHYHRLMLGWVFVLCIFLFVSPFFSQNNDTINQMNNGLRHGYWILSGEITGNKDYVPVAKVEEGLFNNGRRTGLWVKYYPKGAVKSKINYVNGKPYEIS